VLSQHNHRAFIGIRYWLFTESLHIIISFFLQTLIFYFGYLIFHASLILKKLELVVSTRTVLNDLKLDREKVLEWKNGKNMIWSETCAFIDETGLNMHIHRKFGRSKKGTPAKASIPSIRGIAVIIIGTICKKGVINLTLRKPKAV
jgi:hypothetical protein